MVELMISIVIAGVVLGIIAGAIIGVSRINTHNKDRREAVNLSEAKIEEMRRLSFDRIVSGNDVVGKFSRRWVVTTLSTQPRIKRVEVIITWTDARGIRQTQRVNTTYYRNAYPYK